MYAFTVPPVHSCPWKNNNVGVSRGRWNNKRKWRGTPINQVATKKAVKRTIYQTRDDANKTTANKRRSKWSSGLPRQSYRWRRPACKTIIELNARKMKRLELTIRLEKQHGSCSIKKEITWSSAGGKVTSAGARNKSTWRTRGRNHQRARSNNTLGDRKELGHDFPRKSQLSPSSRH